MGEDNHKLNEIFYAKNGCNEKMKTLGETIIEIPKLAPGGLVDGKISYIEEKEEIVIPLNLKVITRKRFIKLLMGMGHQRNEANKMHQEYMKLNKPRTKIGMIFFETFYNVEPKFKLQIGGIEC